MRTTTRLRQLLAGPNLLVAPGAYVIFIEAPRSLEEKM